MPIAIIYTDCRAKKGGDYAGAAELAFTLQNSAAFLANNIRCILTSSEDGVKKFKQMYGNGHEDELTIHHRKFEVVDLEILAGLNYPDIAYYLEVTYCKAASRALVKRLINPKTKLLFVGLAHTPIELVKNDLAVRYSSFSISQQFSCTGLGFGGDRIGVSIYKSDFEPLNHAAYYQVTTTQPYGFVYYSGKKASDNFVGDYLKIASQLTLNCNSYVLVGDNMKSYLGIVAYAYQSKTSKPINIYDLVDQQYIRLLRKPEKVPANEGLENEECALNELNPLQSPARDEVNIVCLASVPNEQMRSLMAGAIPFVGVTGVASALESIAFQKVALYQYISNNEIFINSYHEAIARSLQGDLYSASINDLLSSLSWNEKLSSQDITKIVRYLNTDLLTKKVIEESNNLLQKTDRVVPEICKILEIKEPKSTQPHLEETRASNSSSASYCSRPTQGSTLHRTGAINSMPQEPTSSFGGGLIGFFNRKDQPANTISSGVIPAANKQTLNQR